MTSNGAATRESAFLLGLIAVGALLRIHALGALPLWVDEANSVWVANRPLADAWRYLAALDVHPPLFYVLLHGWQAAFGDSEVAARSLSVLCGVAAIPVVYAAAARWFDVPTARVAAALTAASPFLVGYAQEARQYTLLTLEMACALYLLARLLAGPARHASARDWIALAVVEASLMWTHNTATVFATLALNVGVALMLWRWPAGAPPFDRARFARRWVAAQLAAVLLWLPWLPSFVGQSRRVDHRYWLEFPSFATLLDVVNAFAFSSMPGTVGQRTLLIAPMLVLAAVGVARSRRRPALYILLAILVVPFAGELLVSLRRPIFYERTLIWSSLPFHWFVAAGLVATHDWMRAPVTGPGERRRRLWTAMAATLWIVALQGSGLAFYFSRSRKQEWNRAARYVADGVRPGDVVLLHGSWMRIPFEYYLRRTGVAPELHGVPVELFERGIQEPPMRDDDVPHLIDLARGHRRVWLVYSHGQYTDPGRLVPGTLHRIATRVDSVAFYGVEVMTFAPTPPGAAGVAGPVAPR